MMGCPQVLRPPLRGGCDRIPSLRNHLGFLLRESAPTTFQILRLAKCRVYSFQGCTKCIKQERGGRSETVQIHVGALYGLGEGMGSPQVAKGSGSAA